MVADYTHVNDGNNAVHLFGQSPGFPVMTGLVLGGTTVPLDANGQSINPRLLSINTLPENIQNMGGISATLNWRLSDQFSVRSITAYRKERVALTMDFDETTAAAFPSLAPGKDFDAYECEEQFSQELQFIGHTSRIDLVAGLYYLHDYVDPAFYVIGLNFGVAVISVYRACSTGRDSNHYERLCGFWPGHLQGDGQTPFHRRSARELRRTLSQPLGTGAIVRPDRARCEVGELSRPVAEIRASIISGRKVL